MKVWCGSRKLSKMPISTTVTNKQYTIWDKISTAKWKMSLIPTPALAPSNSNLEATAHLINSSTPHPSAPPSSSHNPFPNPPSPNSYSKKSHLKFLIIWTWHASHIHPHPWIYFEIYGWILLTLMVFLAILPVLDFVQWHPSIFQRYRVDCDYDFWWGQILAHPCL